jgi:GNAT superfamily N-acetyltransferase
VNIRRARAADADAVADIFLAARADMTYLPNLHTDEETRTWLEHVVLAREEVWVAETDGGVAGFAALTDDMLDHLYVRPDAQGRGIGAALLEHAKRRRPAGFRLWVFQKNEVARRFYERHGCRLVKTTDGADNEEREPDALYEWQGADALSYVRGTRWATAHRSSGRCR